MYSSAPFKLPTPVQCAAVAIPLASCSIQAGFPSPAEEFSTKRIDLTEVLIKHPQATYLLRVSGNSMVDAGVCDGDLLVVDKAVKPRHGHIVVAVVGGEFTVKYLHMRAGRFKLKPANATYPEIVPAEGETVEVWGVVTSCIKRFVV
jgi:DNA polymerase V